MTTDKHNPLPPIPAPAYPMKYSFAQLMEYGDARAARERKVALEDAAAELSGMTCNSATARSAIALCVETIKEMK